MAQMWPDWSCELYESCSIGCFHGDFMNAGGNSLYLVRMVMVRGKTMTGLRDDIAQTAAMFAPGAARRAGRRDVYRAYLTHLNPLFTRCANAVLGSDPVIREVLLPDRRKLCYRPGTSDLRVLKQIFVGQEYEPDGLVQGTIEYIVDLGSNIGLSALLWSSLHPSARIVCVEPDEENFGLLQRNIEQLGDRCTAVRAAVADHDGTIDFFRSSSVYFWSSSTDPNIAKGAVQKVTVPAMTMGSILNHAGFPRIDLMKMDIEGGEKSVLPGMPAWPLRPKHLVAELHEPYHFSDFARDVGAGGLVAHAPNERRKMAWAVPGA
jgi:FkbM family methyltransferase